MMKENERFYPKRDSRACSGFVDLDERVKAASSTRSTTDSQQGRKILVMGMRASAGLTRSVAGRPGRERRPGD